VPPKYRATNGMSTTISQLTVHSSRRDNDRTSRREAARPRELRRIQPFPPYRTRSRPCPGASSGAGDSKTVLGNGRTHLGIVWAELRVGTDARPLAPDRLACGAAGRVGARHATDHRKEVWTRHALAILSPADRLPCVDVSGKRDGGKIDNVLLGQVSHIGSYTVGCA